MRETSSRSSTSRDSCSTWRSITSRAQTTCASSAALAHDLDRVADRRQRVAQLVRERRQELVLAAIDVLRLRQLAGCSRAALARRAHARRSAAPARRAIFDGAQRLPPAAALEQQQRDERHRHDQQRAARDEVRAVGLPGAHPPEQDLAPRRQPRLVDLPALQLPPVEHRHDGRVDRRDVARMLAGENPQRRPRRRRRRAPRGCRRSRRRHRREGTSCRARTLARPRCARSRSRCRWVAPDVRLVVRVVRDDEQHEPARAQALRPRQRLRQRQIDEVGELDPRFHPRQLAAQLGREEVVALRRGADDHHLAGRRGESRARSPACARVEHTADAHQARVAAGRRRVRAQPRRCAPPGRRRTGRVPGPTRNRLVRSIAMIASMVRPAYLRRR